jgi:hypothetical protein
MSNAIGSIYSTKKYRAETQQSGLEVDNLKPKRYLQKHLHGLTVHFLGVIGFFFKEGIKTYLLAPATWPLNSPTVFFLFR